MGAQNAGACRRCPSSAGSHVDVRNGAENGLQPQTFVQTSGHWQRRQKKDSDEIREEEVAPAGRLAGCQAWRRGTLFYFFFNLTLFYLVVHSIAFTNTLWFSYISLLPRLFLTNVTDRRKVWYCGSASWARTAC